MKFCGHEGLWTSTANSFEDKQDDGKLIATQMKNVEAKYHEDAKSLSKIQMGVSRAYLTKNSTYEIVKEAWEFQKPRFTMTKKYAP